MLYKGWILAKPTDARLLEGLVGIKLGPYNAETHRFEECEADDEGLDKLNPFWYLFNWAFHPLKTQGGENNVQL